MRYKDVTVNSVLISPYGSEWKVIKRYAADMWLIKNKEKLVCVLTGGQVRKDWRIKDGQDRPHK